MFLSDYRSYRHTDCLSDILDSIEVERIVDRKYYFAVFLTYGEHYILLCHLLGNELNYFSIDSI